jgi:hypothetical protein
MKRHVFDYWKRGHRPKFSYRHLSGPQIGRYTGLCITIEFNGGTSKQAWMAAKALKTKHQILKDRTIVKYE